MSASDPGPIDFTFRYDPTDPKPFFVPKDWREAADHLAHGNAQITRFYDACKRRGYPSGAAPSVVELSELEAQGLPRGPSGFPLQMPFAAIVGCADARAPSEILLGQEYNDLFNIRVAGNVLGPEGLGSLLYAVRTFCPADSGPLVRRLKLVIALGHRDCGAVRAAVQAHQDGTLAEIETDDPIGSILHRIDSPALEVGARAFDAVHGPDASRQSRHLFAMVELVVYLNAAWVSHHIRDWVDREGPGPAAELGVVYAVLDPDDLRLRALPRGDGLPEGEGPVPDVGLFGPPPRDLADLRALAAELVPQLHPVPSGPMA